jgi:UDP-3-O-[3-hydroxymyristoyl] glucosamine N-acyltransferase
MAQFTLKQLAEHINAKLIGDETVAINGIGPLDKAQSGQITFLDNPKYQQFLATTQATAVMLKNEFASQAKTNALIVADPYVAYAKISQLFDDAPKAHVGIHHTAIIGKNCDIEATVSIAAYCVIGDNVKLGKNVRLDAACVLSNDVVIGDNTHLCPGVKIYHKVTIGQGCLLHSGAVVGSDGFGNANDKGRWCKIYQLGAVTIGNDVEIGANTTIDRGALGNTILEDGVRLDNLVQIGHNVRIGAHTAIAGCTGIAGSTDIGRHCMIGGAVGIAGHIKIADRVILTGKSAVGQSITKSGIYASGFPATEHREWWRIVMRIFRIDEIVKRLKALEDIINERNKA